MFYVLTSSPETYCISAGDEETSPGSIGND